LRRKFLAIFAALALLSVGFAPSASASTSMYLTGYSFYDNDPPGRDIAYPAPDYPGNHYAAAGSGSFSNPITLAVGIVNGVPQFKPGTKLYIITLRKYVRVEDSCAACGVGHNGSKWIDVWVDGSTSTVSSADSCMNAITGNHLVITNPANGWAVAPRNPITHDNMCAKQYGETAVWTGTLT
jgi:hypothetical protein